MWLSLGRRGWRSRGSAAFLFCLFWGGRRVFPSLLSGGYGGKEKGCPGITHMSLGAGFGFHKGGKMGCGPRGQRQAAAKPFGLIVAG